jgi:hypothetical protein
MPTPEQLARQQIDAMLIAAGWAVQDYPAFSPGASRGIALREVPLKSGRCDYLLMVDRKPAFRTATTCRHRNSSPWKSSTTSRPHWISSRSSKPACLPR